MKFLQKLSARLAITTLSVCAFALQVSWAEIEKDIPYPHDGEDPENRCAVDIYKPNDAKNAPVVVWFHGGGLYEGKRAIPEELKNQGFLVVAPGYRLHPGVKSPVYIEDAAAAVAWVFNHINEHGGDPKKIFLTGHSAGGYLVTMIALDKKYLAKHSVDSNKLASIIPFSGQVITHFTIRKERGMEPLQPVIDEMAPLYHVRPDAPPILITSGDREKELFGRYEENAYFRRMMKLKGHKDIELIEIPGTDHGSMVKPSFPYLLEFVKKHSADS